MAKAGRLGFTLFEILVVIAIVAIISGLVVGSISRSAERNIKSTASKLASTIRFLYNKSAMEGVYGRLVFDLTERTYWVEATSDPFVMSREEDLEKAQQKKAQEEKKKAATKKTRKDADVEKKDAQAKEGEKKGEGDKEASGDEDEIQRIKPKEAKFGQVSTVLLKSTKLPDSVFIKDLQVEHRRTPVDSGQESIYFFPNGYVEKAIINLMDEKDEINYSLQVNPLTGNVKIEDQYQRMVEQ